MKRVKVYYTEKQNSKYVTGFGYVAGKPAVDLRKGDTILVESGIQKRIASIASTTAASVTVKLQDGVKKKFFKSTIVPIAWDESCIDEAAAYGHRV